MLLSICTCISRSIKKEFYYTSYKFLYVLRVYTFKMHLFCFHKSGTLRLVKYLMTDREDAFTLHPDNDKVKYDIYFFHIFAHVTYARLWVEITMQHCIIPMYILLSVFSFFCEEKKIKFWNASKKNHFPFAKYFCALLMAIGEFITTFFPYFSFSTKISWKRHCYTHKSQLIRLLS